MEDGIGVWRGGSEFTLDCSGKGVVLAGGRRSGSIWGADLGMISDGGV